jgi:hypothetical protein
LQEHALPQAFRNFRSAVGRVYRVECSFPLPRFLSSAALIYTGSFNQLIVSYADRRDTRSLG